MWTFLVLCLLLAIETQQTCTPPKRGRYKPPSIIEVVTRSSTVLWGKVMATYPVLDSTGRNRGEFTAEMEVYCLFKGSYSGSKINITEAGYVQAKCLSYEFYQDEEYLAFLDQTSDGRYVPYTQAKPLRRGDNTQDFRRVLKVCGTHSIQPDGVQPPPKTCPRLSRQDGCRTAAATVRNNHDSSDRDAAPEGPGTRQRGSSDSRVPNESRGQAIGPTGSPRNSHDRGHGITGPSDPKGPTEDARPPGSPPGGSPGSGGGSSRPSGSRGRKRPGSSTQGPRGHGPVSTPEDPTPGMVYDEPRGPSSPQGSTGKSQSEEVKYKSRKVASSSTTQARAPGLMVLIIGLLGFYYGI